MPDTGLKDSPIRLLHISDVHFGSEDTPALEAVAAFARRTELEAILVSGDLTQSGRRREFEAARDWLAGLGPRVIVAPGNHDTPLLHLPARIVSPFGRYARHMAEFDAVGRLVELAGGRLRVSALNTARGAQMRLNWADGVVNMQGFDRAMTELRKGPQDAWRILLCHHPFMEPGGARIAVSTRRGVRALQTAASAGIDAILTGHTHDAFAQPVVTAGRSLVQMGAGTLSTRVRGSYPSFCIIELGARELVQHVVDIEGGGMKIRRNYDSASAAVSSSEVRL